MVMGDIVNLNTLVANAANTYISTNESTFKSTVVGPTGNTGSTGLTGNTGDSLTLTSSVNNGNGSFTLTFSDGSAHTTEVLTGASGVDGVDADALTVDTVTFNSDYTMTIEFSDGTITTTPKSLRGADGRNIHHIVHISSQLPNGDVIDGIGYGTGGDPEVGPGIGGNIDTYAAYADEEELTHVGEITIQNGDSAYTYAVEGGFTGTREEFITTLGLIDDIVDAANNAIVVAEAARDKAQKWAEEVVDVPVEIGQYSALHHATKAGIDATSATASAVTATSEAAATVISASNASTSASASATSEGNATASATAASTSATNAATSASNAQASESAASGSATAASGSAIMKTDLARET